MANIFSKIFEFVASLFSNKKVEQVEGTVGKLLAIAIPIVKEFDQILGGNKTVEGVEAIAEKYGLPILNDLSKGSTVVLNQELMSLAATMVRNHLPEELTGVANNLINSAVALAVSLAHA